MTGRTVVYALFFYSCEQIDLLCSSSMLLNTSNVIDSSDEEEFGEF